MTVIMQIGDVVHSLMQTLKDKGILTEEEEREIVARAQRNACLGTNWGGYDRLHLRDSNCPPYELNPAPNPIADFWESVRRGAKLTSRTERPAMSDLQVSVYLSATSPQNARDLFESCMAEVSEDQLYPDGKLIMGIESGCGQVFTFVKSES